MNQQTVKPIQFKEVSIDIENLSVSHRDPAILSIGAYFFNLDDFLYGHRFYLEIDLASAMEHGNVSASTLQWWLDQGGAAKQVLKDSPDKVGLRSALVSLIGFVAQFKPERFWFNGPAEDAVWLEEAAAKFGEKMPWLHSQKCCVRTLRKLWPEIGDTIDTSKHVAHNALYDAIYQAEMVKNFHDKFIKPQLQDEPV